MGDATNSAVDFQDQGTFKIIWAVNINRVHGHNNISTSMIKIFDTTVVKTVSVFRNSLYSGIFPDNLKRSNIVPNHNQGNKQLIQNYRHVS